MPQVQLPMFPQGVTHINADVAFSQQDGVVTYFTGHLPMFTHLVEDLASFRLYTTQLHVTGSVTQAELVRTFGIPPVTLKRCVKRYREHGTKTFFAPAKPRSGKKLTAEVLLQAQVLLDKGMEIPEVSRELGVFANTLHKAIRAKRLRVPIKKKKNNPIRVTLR